MTFTLVLFRQSFLRCIGRWIFVLQRVRVVVFFLEHNVYDFDLILFVIFVVHVRVKPKIVTVGGFRIKSTKLIGCLLPFK